MQALSFYLTLPFIYLLSILPFGVLYAISDFGFFILYYLIKYRRKVVMENMKNSFPQKSVKELQELEKKFYRYLCDLIVENIKSVTISKAQALARCKILDLTLFEKLYAENKNIILVLGHYGNWEWAATSFSLQTNYQLNVIYRPLSNSNFDRFMYKVRGRFGSKLIAMNDIYKEMLKSKNHLSATAFVADQTPSPEKAYWTNFLEQSTPIFWGTEKIARKLNYPIVFGSVNRIKRGYYEISTQILFDQPNKTATGAISESHTRHLEQEIRKQPEIWLWSHRRWKHKRKIS